MPYVLASFACNVQVLKCKQSLFEVVFQLFDHLYFLKRQSFTNNLLIEKVAYKTSVWECDFIEAINPF